VPEFAFKSGKPIERNAFSFKSGNPVEPVPVELPVSGPVKQPSFQFKSGKEIETPTFEFKSGKPVAEPSLVSKVSDKAKDIGTQVVEGIKATPETALGLGSGLANFMTVTPVAGMGALAKFINKKVFEGKSVDESLDEANKVLESAHSKFSYQPKGEVAQKSLQKVGEAFEFLGKKSAEGAEKLGGGPNVQAITKTVGDIATLLAMGGRRGKAEIKQPTQEQMRSAFPEKPPVEQLREIIEQTKQEQAKPTIKRPEELLYRDKAKEFLESPKEPLPESLQRASELKDELAKVESKAKPEYLEKVTDSKVRTLAGVIKQKGKVNQGNLKGEFKNMPLQSRTLTSKTGRPLDTLETELRSEGWLRPEENLIDAMNDPNRLRMNKISEDISTKRASELTIPEQELKKSMKREPEAPPEGPYTVKNAEDLQVGETVTAISPKFKDGWDKFKVIEKDPFEIIVKDGETVKLSPFDKLEVLGKETKKPIDILKEKVPDEKPIESLVTKRPDEITEQIPISALKRKKSTGAEDIGPIEPLPTETTPPKTPLKPKGLKERDLPGSPVAPKTTKGDRFREIVEDSQIRIRRLQEAEGAKVTEKGNPYRAESLMHGKVKTKLDTAVDIATNWDKDIVKTSKKLKIKDTAFQKDVYDKLITDHVPERNAELGAGKAGMSTSDAIARKAEIENKPEFADIKRKADELMKFHRTTLDILRDSGVIDQKTHDFYRNRYKKHVPLNRELNLEFDVLDTLASKGLDVKGTGIKYAKGSDKPISDMLTNIVAAHESAVVRAEKNLVDLQMAKFIRTNDYFGDMFKEVKPKVEGKRPDGSPIFKEITDPQVLSFRENGKQNHIHIKDPQMAIAIRGVNKQHLPDLMGIIPKFTRFYSELNTKYDPSFAFRNKFKDVQENLIFGTSSKRIGGKKILKATIKDPSSVKVVADAMLGKDTPGVRDYKEMLSEGGSTGTVHVTTKPQLELDMNKIRKLNRSKPRQATKKVLDSIAKWNTIFEDSTRYTTWKAALDNGASKAEAASLAKESTLNFNKMGTGGPLVNSFYMFSNASIRGAVKNLKAMKDPKVAGPVLTAVGSAIYTVNSFNDWKDPEWKDKVSNFDLNSGLVFVTSEPGKKFDYIKIPGAYSLAPIISMFQFAYDATTGKKNSPKKVISEITRSFMEGYSPTGGSSDIWGAVTPTIGKLGGEIARNRTWAGGMIAQPRDKFRAESTRFFDKERESKLRNLTVKGTKKLSESTVVEISPADINYAIQQSSGGAGRFVLKMGELASGEKDLSKLPFTSSFFRSKNIDEFSYNSKLREEQVDHIKEARKEDFWKNVEFKDKFKVFKETSTKDSLRALIGTKQDYEKFKRTYKKGEKNPDYKLVGQMGVENWSRSKYITDKYKAMPTKQAKMDLLRILYNDGYLTKDVTKQLGFLLKEKEK